MTDDDDISRRYRELPREEPPRHLDDAILAASRRAVHTRPAPLVVPSGRQRWYFPVAAAAIIVLAVAVTVHVEREQPAEEIASAPAAPTAAPPSTQEQMREAAPAAPAEKPKPAPQPERRRKAESADANLLRDKPAAAAPPAELQKAPEPSAPAPSQDAASSAAQAYGRVMRRDMAESEVAVAPAAKPQAAPRPPSSVRAVIESKASATTLSASAMQSPEQWLQGIADLRRQARHEEADRELAEFRKRYPDYRLSPEMRRQLEKR